MKLIEITDVEAEDKLRQKNINRMKFRKLNKKPFDNSTTDMPHYDQMMNSEEAAKHNGFEVHTVNIRPREYISACADGFKTSVRGLEQSRVRSGKVDEYEKLLNTGTTFPMLMIQYTADGSFTQEGLHRAFAAERVGIERIPVLVVKEV